MQFRAVDEPSSSQASPQPVQWGQASGQPVAVAAPADPQSQSQGEGANAYAQPQASSSHSSIPQQPQQQQQQGQQWQQQPPQQQQQQQWQPQQQQQQQQQWQPPPQQWQQQGPPPQQQQQYASQPQQQQGMRFGGPQAVPASHNQQQQQQWQQHQQPQTGEYRGNAAFAINAPQTNADGTPAEKQGWDYDDEETELTDEQKRNQKIFTGCSTILALLLLIFAYLSLSDQVDNTDKWERQDLFSSTTWYIPERCNVKSDPLDAECQNLVYKGDNPSEIRNMIGVIMVCQGFGIIGIELGEEILGVDHRKRIEKVLLTMWKFAASGFSSVPILQSKCGCDSYQFQIFIFILIAIVPFALTGVVLFITGFIRLMQKYACKVTHMLNPMLCNRIGNCASHDCFRWLLFLWIGCMIFVYVIKIMSWFTVPDFNFNFGVSIVLTITWSIFGLLKACVNVGRTVSNV